MSEKEKNKVSSSVDNATENNKEESKPPKEKKQKNFKKLKFGSVSAVVLVMVIAITVIINLMVSTISKRYPLKIDLTPDNRYELSDDSINFLENLDKNVEITVTSPKDTFTSMATYFKQMYRSYYGINVDIPYDIIPEILDKYSVYSGGKVSVKYSDINKDPDVVTRYNQYYSGEIGEGSIVVFSGERIKVISNDDVINMITANQASTQNAISMSFAGESTITSAIMSVVDSNPIKAGIITKMNGNAISENAYQTEITAFNTFLSKNGYDCSEVDIATDELSPESYDIIVLAMPSVDFSADIITKMGDFLYNDGKYNRNMLYIPNLYATNLPNIDEFLADWSISIGTSVVLDENSVQVPIQSLGVMDTSPVVTVADSESVGTLPNDKLPIASPYSRVVNTLSKNNESKVTEILKSSDTAYLRDLTAETQGEKETGVYTVASVSSKSTAEGLEVYKSNVLVIGSSFMMDSALLTNTNTYNNASVIIGMINNITGKETGAVIADKSLQQATIAPTATEARIIRIFVIYAIPLIIAVTGVIVLARRRNR